MTNWPLLLGIATTLFGGFGLFAIYQVFSLRRITRESSSVSGKVLDVIEEEERGPANRLESNDAERIIVGYRVDQTDHRIEWVDMMYPSFFKKGQVVTVYYQPGQPERGKVIGLRAYAKWMLLAAVCFGIVVGLFAAWMHERGS